MTDEFHILLRDRSDSIGDRPVQAPDEEPDALELVLWQFCYDHNRRVVIQVGDRELESELDPDICVLWPSLPEQVARLAAGEREVLHFSERWYDVALEPRGDVVACTIEKWGHDPWSAYYLCDRNEVLGELRRFLDELADLAVAGGYLTPAQRETLMGGRPVPG